MKNILALIGLVVVLVVGLGWYLEWFQVKSQPGSDGHRTFNVDVNTKGIVDDVKTGAQKVTNIITNDNKGTTVVPTPEKKVQGQPTGLQENSDGSWSIIPPFKVIGN